MRSCVSFVPVVALVGSASSYNPAMRSLLSAALIWTALAVVGHTQDAGSLQELEKTLTFESAHSGTLPAGWTGGPQGTVFVDGAIVHGGRWSARLERTATSPEAFSTLTKAIP